MARRTLLVVTEHVGHLTPGRSAGYERFAAELARVSETEVDTIHYLEGADLAAADAVVLSGSRAPWAAHDPNALDRLRADLVACPTPVLGVCAGMQLLVEAAGGRVRPLAEAGKPPERGFGPLEVVDADGLLEGLPDRATVFHDHEDEVVSLPDSLRNLARSESSAVQAIASREGRWWGTQFHPERHDAAHPDGALILANFFRLAG